jgi:hypothetical protein
VLAKLRPRSVYDVLAAIGCFVALGGTSAYAINEWTGANIVDESLTGADVQGKAGTTTTPAVNGSLTTHDVAGQQGNTGNGTPFIEGTLTQWDIKNGAVTGADLASDTVAAADIATDGVRASEIATEAVGPVELANIFFVDTVESVPANGGVAEVVATCSPGSQLISGGAWFDFPSGDVSSSFPGGGTSWVVEGQNNGQFAQNLRARAWCMPPPVP